MCMFMYMESIDLGEHCINQLLWKNYNNDWPHGICNFSHNVYMRFCCVLFCCRFVISCWWFPSDFIMSTMESQMTSVSTVYSNVCWGTDQRKHQSSASLAFVREIPRWPVNFPHKRPVTWKMFPLDYVIMPLIHLPWFCRVISLALG